ncbi:MAG: glutathione S-transferase [Pseudomonadota bacterium]
MDYVLYLGDRAYSSWSLRAWLLCDVFKLPVRYRYVDFSDEAGVAAQLADAAPARTVPTLKTPEGAIISESLAIAEELATRFPDAGLWPSAAKARAIARGLASEMHAGFGALRGDCPMNLRLAYAGFEPRDAVTADVERIETIWDSAKSASGGPWLCGEYSIADAFFAPVAARIATYGLNVGPVAADYVAQHLAHLPFRRWRAMGLVSGATLPWYAMPHAHRNWPGPVPLAATPIAAEDAQPLNRLCPYSQEPVTDFLRLDGRDYGFCNPFCRDKTAADPEAWPHFMALTREP